MKLVADLKRVVWFDAALFHKRRKLLLACVGATLVPALYAAIYLSSAWDPYGHLDALPVALVDLDRGVDVPRHVVVGATIVDKLHEAHTFAWRDVASEDEAKAAVTHGDVVFAVVIPDDFSANAVPGAKAKPGRVRILFSEGNNFMAATIAKRFAGELAHGTNEALNEERWSVVLQTVDQSKGGLDKLKTGVAQLVDGSTQLVDGMLQAHDGASQLHDGASQAHIGATQLRNGGAQLSDGVGALTDGVQKLGDGVRTLDDKLPSTDTLAQLKDGAHQVREGNATLASGIEKLDGGAHQAKAGAAELRTKTAKVPIVGGKIAAGAGKLEDGLDKLGQGLDQAKDGSDKLAAGTKKLDDGVTRLADGIIVAHEGVHAMATRLPAAEQLARLKTGAAVLADGTGKLDDGLAKLDDGAARLHDGLGALSDGANRLHAGLALLQSSLPSDDVGGALTGDARGLASSVEPEMISLTSVGPYGNSMAPYFIGLSLWVGVVMTGFIFRLRWFPARLRAPTHTLRPVSRVSLALGRLAIPLPIVVGQATLLVVAMHFVGVTLPSLASVLALWFLAVVTAITFLCVLTMLIAICGDIGKVIALLLLVFQMSASAGVFPIELSAVVFRFVHPYLPFSWVVTSSRALLFGAYDGAWLPALARVALFGVLSLAITAAFGRWKLVARHDYAPLLDL